MTYQVLVDGESVSLRSRRPFRFACCDCGLVHDVAIMVGQKGWFGFAVKRNQRETVRRRAQLGEHR